MSSFFPRLPADPLSISFRFLLNREAALACLREEEDEYEKESAAGRGREEPEKERTGRIGLRHFQAAMRGRRDEEEGSEDSDGMEEA